MTAHLPPKSDRLVPLQHLATRAGVSLPTARRYIENGLVRGVNVSSSPRPRWRVFESEIERFVESRTTPASR